MPPSGAEQPRALTRFASTNTYERSVGVIARPLACRDFLPGLFVGHSGINAFKDLTFGQSGILELRDFRAGHDRLAGQMLVENELHRGVRKPDELERDSVNADRVQLARVRDVEDLLLGESGAGQVSRRLRADEKDLVEMRGANQLHAGVIAKPRMFQLNDLGDFRAGTG